MEEMQEYRLSNLWFSIVYADYSRGRGVNSSRNYTVRCWTPYSPRLLHTPLVIPCFTFAHCSTEDDACFTSVVLRKIVYLLTVNKHILLFLLLVSTEFYLSMRMRLGGQTWFLAGDGRANVKGTCAKWTTFQVSAVELPSRFNLCTRGSGQSPLLL